MCGRNQDNGDSLALDDKGGLQTLKMKLLALPRQELGI
jgi:hypothetical protein